MDNYSEQLIKLIIPWLDKLVTDVSVSCYLLQAYRRPSFNLIN
ncbi:hypothetical protein SAMN05216406_13036 [Nitrosomonas ureae]|uniref:Uncharacterized protein n=1 Tax=Nitrosomonas ureae TaxID=44577 RepID=A0A1H2GCU9_9PROT|nr:hypothetical protein SAMN05216406_13036 [Nitrosomonas ureae]